MAPRRIPERQESQSETASVSTVVQTSLPAVEKLKGSENWANWKFVMELTLQAEELYDCVIQDPEVDAAENALAPEIKRNNRARTRICLSLDPSLFCYVRDAKTAKQCWDRLSDAFEDKGVHRRLALLMSLIEVRQDAGMPLKQYVLRMKDAVAKIDSTGKPLEDDMAAVILLRNLNPEYKNLRQLIERTCVEKDREGEETLPFMTVIAELMKEASKEEAEDGGPKALKSCPAPSSGIQTNAPRSSSGPRHRGAPGGSRWNRGGKHQQGSINKYGGGQRPSAGQADLKDCSKCQSGNHTWDFCPKGKFNPCSYCKRTNHPSRSEERRVGKECQP